MTLIKLVLFDALHTIITPRLPIHLQYAHVFQPYLGVLDPTRVQSAFKTALKEIQQEKPVYVGGKEGWWGDVISRTAIGAGADPQAVKSSQDLIVPTLLKRFSGKQGYKAFDDVVPTLTKLRQVGVRTGLVSNADLRIKNVLSDLKLLEYLDPLVVSEEEGIEKPAKEIWERACSRAGVNLDEALHVGDEMECDYLGARRAGLAALLLRRPGEDQPAGEDVTNVHSIAQLTEVVTQILGRCDYSDERGSM